MMQILEKLDKIYHALHDQQSDNQQSDNKED